MLFPPEAHEALADEPWSAERPRAAVAAIVADAETAFVDGSPPHPGALPLPSRDGREDGGRG